jgi:predicted acetyltransferase
MIKLILDNPKTCEIKIKPFMMGRVINLKGFLESLEVDKNINISSQVNIIDEFIEENNGLFDIKVSNGKVKVSKIGDLKENGFSINTISQMAFSYIDVDEAVILNNLDVSKDTIKLFKNIFNKKNNYINEYV